LRAAQGPGIIAPVRGGWPGAARRSRAGREVRRVEEPACRCRI